MTNLTDYDTLDATTWGPYRDSILAPSASRGNRPLVYRSRNRHVYHPMWRVDVRSRCESFETWEEAVDRAMEMTTITGGR